MAQTKIITPPTVVERNIRLVQAVMRYLFDNPHLSTSLPDKFELVVLPEDDPEMRLYNLELLDKYGSEGSPIVFARVKMSGEKIDQPDKLSLYTPVPIAV